MSVSTSYLCIWLCNSFIIKLRDYLRNGGPVTNQVWHTHIYIIYMSDFYQSWGDSFWCNYFQCYNVASRVIIATVKRFNIIDVTSYWTISGKHFTLSAWPFYCTISDRMIFGTLNASRYFIGVIFGMAERLTSGALI